MMKPDKVSEWRVRIEGRVQGVGFRAGAQNLARLHHVTGFVRNLPDGAVEICAQAEAGDFQAFIEDLQKRRSLGSVDQIKINPQEIREKHSSFLIR